MAKLLVTTREVHKVHYSIEIENTEEGITKGLEEVTQDLDTVRSLVPLSSSLVSETVSESKIISEDEYHLLRTEAGRIDHE
jgi:hypothetical protein